MDDFPMPSSEQGVKIEYYKLTLTMALCTSHHWEQRWEKLKTQDFGQDVANSTAYGLDSDPLLLSLGPQAQLWLHISQWVHCRLDDTFSCLPALMLVPWWPPRLIPESSEGGCYTRDFLSILGKVQHLSWARNHPWQQTISLRQAV